MGALVRKFVRRLCCFIAVSRLLVFSRRCARYLGERLKKIGKELVIFGESESGGSWGAVLFDHLPFSELEVSGSFKGAYRGKIVAAFFRCSQRGPERNVVLRISGWTGEPRGQRLRNFWDNGEYCDIIVDPALSPLHVLPDGTLWFMWPTGETGVIRGNFGNIMKRYLRIDTDDTAKVREPRESHFRL